ncbi:MAG: TetR/AcrR family transcriptional regulator [Gammaproteobacteria bacterium]
MTKVRWGKSIQSKDEQYDLKRSAILRTAGRLFNQKGFRETSLNDLADELQVTKPTLYYYVENKEDILFQCLHTAITELLDQTDAILQAPLNGIEKLTRFIHMFIAVFDDEFGRCLAHPGPEPLSSKYLEQIAPLYVRVDSAMRQMIEDGIADKSMRPCNSKISAFALFGAINWMTRWYHPEGEMTTREVADAMVQLFCQGLMPR